MIRWGQTWGSTDSSFCPTVGQTHLTEDIITGAIDVAPICKLGLTPRCNILSLVVLSLPCPSSLLPIPHTRRIRPASAAYRTFPPIANTQPMKRHYLLPDITAD